MKCDHDAGSVRPVRRRRARGISRRVVLGFAGRACFFPERTLQMVPAHDLDLAVVVLVLPLQEVDLLEELPLVKLEFPHVRSRDGRVVAPSADRLLGSRCSRLKPSADAGPARTTCSKTS